MLPGIPWTLFLTLSQRFGYRMFCSNSMCKCCYNFVYIIYRGSVASEEKFIGCPGNSGSLSRDLNGIGWQVCLVRLNRGMSYPSTC